MKQLQLYYLFSMSCLNIKTVHNVLMSTGWPLTTLEAMEKSGLGLIRDLINDTSLQS